MFERIYVEAYDSVGRISIETDVSTAIVISKPQAQQLIIDLQKLVDGNEPDEDATIEGVE